MAKEKPRFLSGMIEGECPFCNLGHEEDRKVLHRMNEAPHYICGLGEDCIIPKIYEAMRWREEWNTRERQGLRRQLDEKADKKPPKFPPEAPEDSRYKESSQIPPLLIGPSG